MRASPIRLAVLDMAGTTIDEGGAVYVALADTVSAVIGRPVPDADLKRWMGADKREAISGLLTTLHADVTATQIEDAFADFSHRLDDAYRTARPTPMAGIEDAIGRLRADGVQVVLTTGFSSRVATGLLDGLDWTTGPTIDAFVTAEQAGAGRPSPKMIALAMELTGVSDPEAVLVAGDTVLDLEAGANAGAGTIVGVLTGAQDRATLERGPATHILASAADLPELITSLT